MHITRRFALAGTAALTACTPGTTNAPSAAQVIADAQAIVTGLARVLPALKPLLPPATYAQVDQDVTLAQGLVVSLSAVLSDGANANTLMQIEDLVNEALALVAGIPGVPPEVAAVAAPLPVLEIFINAAIPQQAVAMKLTRVPAAVPAPKMTADQARVVLKAKGP